MKKKKLRAIDLYAGIGGWSLGLRLANIDVVASYDIWGAANETNFKNNGHQAQTVDIRRLSVADLPKDIDIVVGSPPCTEFSFSNRGGNGDLDDGLKDIIKFLSIVDYLKPKAWAMENVPRVASIIDEELSKTRGRLRKFRHLDISTHLVDMADYGVPQHRKRCIVGNFNFALLKSYGQLTVKRTLGDVVRALELAPVIDPNFGFAMPREKLFDQNLEQDLNEEEVRINRSAKTLHPVYNSMQFPDRLDRSVRTITATCTRVSRESIVIECAEKSERYRRLSIRERASLQGFPITYQFYAKSYGQKLRMIGNAIPPTFAYLMAHSFTGTARAKLSLVPKLAKKLVSPVPLPQETRPDRPGSLYPHHRKFRFAIPSLRLKSGVRFELVNFESDGRTLWKVAFWFGNSKSIHDIKLDHKLSRFILEELSDHHQSDLFDHICKLEKFIRESDLENMQKLWSHRGPGLTRPFMLLDELSRVGTEISGVLANEEILTKKLVTLAVNRQYGVSSDSLIGILKLMRNAPIIVSGFIVGSVANSALHKISTSAVKKRAVKL